MKKIYIQPRCGGVDKAMTDLNSVDDTPLALSWIRNLIYPETQDGHLKAVV